MYTHLDQLYRNSVQLDQGPQTASIILVFSYYCIKKQLKNEFTFW